jgi:hypothetical protein
MLTPQQVRALKEKLLYIDNKQRKVVPFRHNTVQKLYNQRKGLRNIILKARQMGLSADELASMFVEAITIPNTTCVVVSHETLATKRLLDRIHFYYDSMEDPKPVLGSGSRTEMSFPELHSTIYIGTAGSMTFGRGDRIDHAHLSEIAFYEDGERIINAVEEAVPMDGIITMESSPNGEGNAFFEWWAKANEGRNSYKPLFFPWWLNPEYSMPAGHPLALEEDRGKLFFTEDELELIAKHNLTENQIRWRRYKIANKGALFFQEYPEDSVSCFITAGDPVFNSFELDRMASECYEGTFHPSGWQVWIPPEEVVGSPVLAADTSAGAPNGSFSAFVVLDDLWRVCATYQKRVEPQYFAQVVREAGEWYGNCLVVVERNFTGYTVLSHLQDYPNLYYQRDFVTGKTTTQRGWWTNEQTKEHMRTALRDKLAQLHVYDINLVRQARSYRFIKLKPVAQTFDDLVISLMIACAVKKVSGVARGFMGVTPGWNW